MKKDEPILYKLLNLTKTETKNSSVHPLSTLEKSRHLKRLKSQIKTERYTKAFHVHPGYMIAVITIICLLGSQTNTFQKVQAATASFLQDIHYSLSEALGQNSPSEATVNFNQVNSIGDIDIKVEDFIMIDQRLMFNLLIDLSSQPKGTLSTGFDEFEVIINGESINSSSVVGLGSFLDTNQSIENTIYIIDRFDPTSIPEEMTIEIQLQNLRLSNFSVLTDIDSNPSLVIEGEASFKQQALRSTLQSHVKSIALDNIISVDEIDYHLGSLFVHPVISYLTVDTESSSIDYQLLEFRGVTEKNQVVIFTRDYYTAGDGATQITFNFSEELSEITLEDFQKTELLTLQLYSAGHPEGTDANYLPYGDPFTINTK